MTARRQMAAARIGRPARPLHGEQSLWRGLFLGPREQLGMSSASLRRAWDAVTDEQLRRAAREVFGTDRHAGAFIVVEK